ncbi:MAG: FtsQ-type POTRA domain-containing protein [Candidatus Phosphoribacter sp.]
MKDRPTGVLGRVRRWLGAPARGARSSRRPGRAKVSSSRVRFEQRAAAARQRPLRLAAAVLAVVVVLGSVGWVVWGSEVLNADHVAVEGVTDEADRAEVLAVAAVPLGQALARIDTGAIAARVGALPFVRRAAVNRSWPHTVTVVVTARVPLLLVRGPEGELALVDEDGVAFRTVTDPPSGLPLVNGSANRPEPEGLQAVIDILRLLPEGQRSAVTEITVTSASLVSFKLGRVQIVWGGRAQPDKKLAVLTALLATKPALIDVSAPDTPVTR